ncbi:hypothetical protein KJ780_02405, partial [Candidatus Micrarchaeota archaeon]|nr:hypothetical protein [Candidatus Micrarchaeota archaeon]
ALCKKEVVLYAGPHFWNITCDHILGATIQSETRSLNITAPPTDITCTLKNPSNNSEFPDLIGSGINVQFDWHLERFNTPHKCELVLNYLSFNAGPENMDADYSVPAIITEGEYLWSVLCYNSSIFVSCGPNSLAVVKESQDVTLKEPLDSAIISSSSPVFRWIPEHFIVNPECNLSLSNGNIYRYSCENNKVCSSPSIALPEGPYSWNVSCNSTYGTNNFSKTSQTNSFWIDATKPNTILYAENSSGAAYTCNTPTTDTISVTLSCADPGGSGCSSIEYCVSPNPGCTPNTKYVDPIVISTKTFFRYRSYDKAIPPNIEAIQECIINSVLDSTPPTTSISMTNSEGSYNGVGTSTSIVTVTLSCNDAGSGCDKTYYCLNDGGGCTERVYANSIQVGEGNWDLEFYSVDNAGIEEAHHHQQITVQFPPQPHVPSCTGLFQISNYGIVGIAGMLTVLLIALLYMVSQYIQSPQLEGWARAEIRELIIAGITISIILSATVFSTGAITQVLTGKDPVNLISDVDGAFTVFKTALMNDYQDLVKIANRLGLIIAYTYSASIGSPVYIAIFFGNTTTPYMGGSALMQQLSVLAGSIANGIMIYSAMTLFMKFFYYLSSDFILPIGLALRFIPFTRKIGGTMIGLALAGLFVYPIAMALVAELHTNIALTTPLHSQMTSADFAKLELNLPSYLTMFCTNDFIRMFVNINEFGWWFILCTPICLAYAAIAASSCATGYAACFATFFWACWQPFYGSCWQIVAGYFYPGVQTALFVTSTVAAIVQSEHLANIAGRNLDALFDIIMDKFIIPVSRATAIPVMEAVLVGGLTIVGARALSAVLNGEVAISGLERLI